MNGMKAPYRLTWRRVLLKSPDHPEVPRREQADIPLKVVQGMLEAIAGTSIGISRKTQYGLIIIQ